MGLQECKIKSEYRSLIDNVVQDFYIPLLKQATVYKRAVGFFSSSSLIEISKGIASIAANGGKIQIVASPYLSDEDVEAIRRGYEEREKIIENALLRDLSSVNKPELVSWERRMVSGRRRVECAFQLLLSLLFALLCFSLSLFSSLS